MQSLFKYWDKLPADRLVHPADQPFLDERAHNFELHTVPSPWDGPLATAPIVLCTLNPGSDSGGYDNWVASDPNMRAKMFRQLRGDQPLVVEHRTATQWIGDRIKFLCDGASSQKAVEQLAGDLAIFNLFPYRSKKFDSKWADTKLPSAENARRFVREVLYPDAKAGKRFVVIIRSRKEWRIREDMECGCFRLNTAIQSGHVDKTIRPHLLAFYRSLRERHS